MGKQLRQDICGLRAPGVQLSKVDRRLVNQRLSPAPAVTGPTMSGKRMSFFTISDASQTFYTCTSSLARGAEPAKKTTRGCSNVERRRRAQRKNTCWRASMTMLTNVADR
jgi:hypothetical protein